MFTFTAKRSNRHTKASFFCHFILISSLVFSQSAEKICRFPLKLFDMLLSCINPFFLTSIPSFSQKEEKPLTCMLWNFIANPSKLHLLQVSFRFCHVCHTSGLPSKKMSKQTPDEVTVRLKFCQAIIKLTQMTGFHKSTSLYF